MDGHPDPLKTQFGAAFPETNVGDLAGRDAASIARMARLYLPPMKSHLIRRFRVQPDRANDLLQSFLAEKLLASPAILDAFQPGRGRFRTLLLTALDNFVRSTFRYERAGKRSADGPVADLHDEDAPPVADPQAADAARAFDREWARGVVAQAVEELRDECERDGRPDLWLVFEAKLVGPLLHAAADVPYEVLVRRLNAESPRQVQNLLQTARRRFVQVVARVASEHGATGSPEDVVAELFDALQ